MPDIAQSGGLHGFIIMTIPTAELQRMADLPACLSPPAHTPSPAPSGLARDWSPILSSCWEAVGNWGLIKHA